MIFICKYAYSTSVYARDDYFSYYDYMSNSCRHHKHSDNHYELFL